MRLNQSELYTVLVYYTFLTPVSTFCLEVEMLCYVKVIPKNKKLVCCCFEESCFHCVRFLTQDYHYNSNKWEQHKILFMFTEHRSPVQEIAGLNPASIETLY